MIVWENMCMEVVRRWYKNSTTKKKIWEIYGLVIFCEIVFCSNKVTWKYYINVLVKYVEINSIKWGSKQDYCLNGDYKLFIDKNQFKAMRVNYSIASISLFRIDIPLSSNIIDQLLRLLRYLLSNSK